MRTYLHSIPVVGFLLVPLAQGQSFAPSPATTPDDAIIKSIKEKRDELGKAITSLRRQGMPDAVMADVEVFEKAADWIVKHGEWYQKEYGQWTQDAIAQGMERVKQLKQGQTPWLKEPGRSVRGYRSRIDGSVQPYGIILPPDFGSNPKKKWRLDVVLHGRDASLTEVKFIHQHDPALAAPDQDFIQMDIYGRGNNAYRWAGERDIFEAMFHFALICKQLLRVEGYDTSKVVLRGFSMGGAGAWHLGLHYPHNWCSVNPGAGFTTTKGYAKNLPDPLPRHQDACLRLYDAIDYAENAFNVPIVAYGGEKDPQLAAAKNIEAVLKPLNIPMTLIVGPNTEHKYHPESLKRIMALQAEHAAKGKPEYPKIVRFVTYHPQFGKCYWAGVLAQDKQYQRSFVDAERGGDDYVVKTENVAMLELELGFGRGPQTKIAAEIDGQKLEAPSTFMAPLQQNVVIFQKNSGTWSVIHPSKLKTDMVRRHRKAGTLTGPIDLAFVEPFLCVRGTGQPWNEQVQAHANASLERFRDEWSKYFRGKLEVKDDVDVTPEDMEARHLILFGDPGSNSLIRMALDRLPLEWSKERLRFGGKDYEAATHVPALIYPSPYSTSTYVVLNTGHTFHATDFEGTNALLFPRLGDYAILKATPTEKEPWHAEVITAGLFDENWGANPE